MGHVSSSVIEGFLFLLQCQELFNILRITATSEVIQHDYGLNQTQWRKETQKNIKAYKAIP